ncbi:transcriptional regulator [Flavobacterium gawalongense]|uniref:Transcriptional regulator n=1 Tax=Flavobacterium gawalongense TaxID=2594432 RepID=A0ABY3CRL2_9FLAO|nr:transcriptional regulator [Flavobacterium gawalongense]TRX03211.1 transcriptional regulator [Flavobacterium gawalongense]TRX09873.1 transcriptional regulator [Flavobacterium gawalongense]
MNYIKHLTGFFKKINNETNLNPTHISLYLALFQCWNVNRFKNPTGISREEIMKASKINSKATYHKCMKELELLGFMEYNPTFNPHSCSNIIMANFSEEEKTISKIPQPTRSKNEPVHNLTDSKNEQVIEQVNEQLYIYNKKQTAENILNNIKIDIDKNLINQPVQNLNPLIIPKEKNDMLKVLADDNRQILPAFVDTDKKQTESGRQKSCAKKEKPVELELIFDHIIPTLELAIDYFLSQENTEMEANKFFNYYSSIGWLIGGKTKMKDWKAAARNWIMNQNKFKVNSPAQTLHPQNLNTVTNKNYAEPL